MRPTGATSSAGLNAGGEVLLAAGAIHSPQVLMASGVGPASHLGEHGIDVVADLPGVGSNLQDHPAILTAFRFRDDAGRVSITDHIYDDDANIKPLQVRHDPQHSCPVTAILQPLRLSVSVRHPGTVVDLYLASWAPAASCLTASTCFFHLTRKAGALSGRNGMAAAACSGCVCAAGAML